MNFNSKLNYILNYIYKPVVDSIFPPVCFLCDSLLENDRKIICQLCWKKLKPLSIKNVQDINKAIIKSNINDIFVLYDFTEEFQKIIHLLKYERCLTLGQYFAQELVLKYSESFFGNYDYIIPVPLHPVKMRERGYNQSYEIIKHVPGEINRTIIKRIKQTQSQTTLSRQERIQNVGGAFVCLQLLKNGKVLLFDDILTTGSTLNECAGVLKKNGIRVDIMSLAAPLKHAIN